MLNDPSGGGTPVTLYRIHTVPNKQKLYKIDINAQQNHLTGVAAAQSTSGREIRRDPRGCARP